MPGNLLLLRLLFLLLCNAHHNLAYEQERDAAWGGGVREAWHVHFKKSLFKARTDYKILSYRIKIAVLLLLPSLDQHLNNGPQQLHI